LGLTVLFRGLMFCCGLLGAGCCGWSHDIILPNFTIFYT
jgi:hypothetical protein